MVEAPAVECDARGVVAGPTMWDSAKESMGNVWDSLKESVRGRRGGAAEGYSQVPLEMDEQTV